MAPKGVAEPIFGRHPVLEALRAGVQVDKVLVARGTKPVPILVEIEELARAHGTRLVRAERGELNRLAGTDTHQGVVAMTRGYEYASLDELVESEPVRLVMLDGVTDPGNLGSILRSAEAFGWSGVIVPKHRSVGVTPAVRKVAAGAAEIVPVAQVSSAADAVARLKRKGVWVMGLDPQGEADYRDAPMRDADLALVVGAEGKGLSRLVRERCDELVSIPMKGSLASLNVAVAAAVVMVEVTRSSS